MEGKNSETRQDGQFVDTSGRSRASLSNTPSLVVDGRTDSEISGRRATDAEIAEYFSRVRRGEAGVPGRRQKGNAP